MQFDPFPKAIKLNNMAYTEVYFDSWFSFEFGNFSQTFAETSTVTRWIVFRIVVTFDWTFLLLTSFFNNILNFSFLNLWHLKDLVVILMIQICGKTSSIWNEIEMRGCHLRLWELMETLARLTEQLEKAANRYSSNCIN